MICVSVGSGSVRELLDLMDTVELVELRLDLLSPSFDGLEKLLAHPTSTIVTLRPGGIPEGERIQRLSRALELGADMIDIEMEMDREAAGRLVRTAHVLGHKVIVSFHDHGGTPTGSRLDEIVDSCFERGADIAKISCRSHSASDNARMLGLLDDDRKVVIAPMGPEGLKARAFSLLLGAPFTYACRGRGEETAEGQPTLEELKRVYDLPERFA